MKKLLILFILLIYGMGYSQITVATMDSRGTITYNENFQTVKNDLKKVLLAQNNNALLENFEIKSDTTENSKYYYVLATNRQSTVKVAHTLRFIKSSFIYNTNDPSGTTTCSGCAAGCNPKLGNDGYYFCTSGTDGSGCIKSTTVPTHYP